MTTTPTSGSAHSGTPAGDAAPTAPTLRFFDWIRDSGFERGTDRWLAGVCGGIAVRTGLEPLIVRGIVVVIAILGGPVVFFYAVAWALMPDRYGIIYAEEALNKRFEPAMVAIGALLLLTLAPGVRGLWWNVPIPGWGMPLWLSTTLFVGWALLLAAAVIGLIVYLVRRFPAGPTLPAAPAEPAAADVASAAAPVAAPVAAPIAASTPADAARPVQPQGAARREARDADLRARYPGAGFTAITVGIALLSGATAAALSLGTADSADSAGRASIALVIGLATALAVLGLGIIASGIRGRFSGALGGLSFITAAALVIAGVVPQDTQFSPFGGTTWSPEPTTLSSALGAGAVPGYAMIAGQATLDLSALADSPSEDLARTIDVWVGVGVTEIELPEGAAVRIETNALVGGIDTGARGVERGGVLFRDSRTVAPAGDVTAPGATAAVPLIRIWTLLGQVVLVDPSR
ncbi:MAG: PspC domain-containing protein [Cryobacterium sp.]